MTWSLRQRLGITAVEVPRYLWSLWGGGDWVRLHNRLERLVPAPSGHQGVSCAWPWTSDLRACNLYPALGKKLLTCALRDWPVGWHPQPVSSRFVGEKAERPVVSFVIGHRGEEKLPHLMATLQSILSQDAVSTEVLVVEQSTTRLIPQLPPRVRHILTPPPYPDMPYSRSWAFNVGARMAAGDILVFHDNDLLVPKAYAKELAGALTDYDLAYLGRFVFYLSCVESRRLMAEMDRWSPAAPLQVTQNFRGGSVAIRRETLFEVGGFDEGFVGWGGEDNEFFDRCKSHRCFLFGYLPFVHLYHRPQPTKADTRVVRKYLDERVGMSREARIRELAAASFGSLDGPLVSQGTDLEFATEGGSPHPPGGR